MTSEVIIRRRVHPLGKPKSLPKRRDRWPRCELIVHSRLDATGKVEVGSVLTLAGDVVVRERLIYGGAAPTDELVAYAATHRARTIAGASRRIELVSRAKAGRLFRTRGYRRGHAIVTAGVASQLSGLADSWTESSAHPGAWSLGLAGLGSPYRGRSFKLYRDAPGVLLTPIGDVVLAGWSGTAPDEVPPDGKRRRPPARRGPILDVLAAGAALAGKPPSGLAAACAAFEVETPVLGDHPIDQLRAETLAIAELYRVEMDVVRELALGMDPSTLVSTGGVATAVLREAGVPALAGRLDLPDQVAGAAASAFFGGLCAALVVHVPVRTVELDISGTFARGASAVGTQDLLLAEHVEVRDARHWAPGLLAQVGTGSAPLGRDVLRRLGRVLVHATPEGQVLPVKAVRDHEARLVMAPVFDPGWWWATDLLAGAAVSGGEVAPIDDALEMAPVGVVPGLRPVRLPTGQLVDLTCDDLAIALLDERAAVKADDRLPAWRRELLDGLLKGLAVTVFYGNLARIDRERLSSPALDEALGPDGERVGVLHPYRERPGPYASLALAGMVTAMARLMVCRAIGRIEAAGGTVLALNVDSILVAATDG